MSEALGELYPQLMTNNCHSYRCQQTNNSFWALRNIYFGSSASLARARINPIATPAEIRIPAAFTRSVRMS